MNIYSWLLYKPLIAIITVLDVACGTLFAANLFLKLNLVTNMTLLVVVGFVILMFFQVLFITSIRKSLYAIFDKDEKPRIIIFITTALLAYVICFLSSYNGIVYWVAKETNKVELIDMTFEKKSNLLIRHYDSLVSKHQKTYDSLIANNSKFTAINEFERGQITYNQKLKENSLKELNSKLNRKLQTNSYEVENSKTEYKYIAYILFVLSLIFNIFDVYLNRKIVKVVVIEKPTEVKVEEKIEYIQKHKKVAEIMVTIPDYKTMPMKTLQAKIKEQFDECPSYVTINTIRKEL